MAYAPTVIAGTTGLLVHPIGFPYLSVEHVTLTIDTVDLAVGGSTWAFSNEGTEITFVNGQEPATGEDLVISRTTPTDVAPVTFRNGAGITAADLNAASLAPLYAIEEAEYYKESTSTPLPDPGASKPGVKELSNGYARKWQAFLECDTTDGDFDPGDRIDVSNTQGYMVEFDDTWKQYFLFQQDTGGTVLDHSGTAYTLTEASWSFVMRAWPE